MYKIKYKITIILTLAITLVFSCKDLDELNINPNGVDPADGHPNLLIATVMSEVGKRVVDLGFGDIAGVMQHTQKDGWSGGHNDYDWFDGGGGKSWGEYYNILRTNDELLNKADEFGLDFHKGVGLVMRAYTFGLITDLWGDAPYTNALNGEEGGEANLKPIYDNQKDIYMGIIADLETANELLSKDQSEYSNIIPAQDVFYNGKVSSWRKLANSLALRYYMRISDSNKEESFAKAGIEKIVGDQSNFPIIASSDDDATMDYIGASPDDSWPSNTVFDISTSGSYNRIKVCATLIDTLKALSDPRIGVYANNIELALVVDPALPDDGDIIIGNERHVSQQIADKYEADYGPLDLSTDYIGLPPSKKAAGIYNLNPNIPQGELNPHCSQLNSMYKNASGPMLKARLMSASEVHFILAEAAQKGWSVGDAESHYNAGIMASLETWGVSDEYENYISGAAAYDGSLQQLIQQKWISSWTAAAESWFDYRRPGYPKFNTGTTAKKQAIPLRFYYMFDEKNLNPANYGIARDELEKTSYADDEDSAWSKSWLLIGTGLPY